MLTSNKSQHTFLSLASVGKDHHYFTLFGVQNRVHGEELSSEQAYADVAKLLLSTWIPSVNDCVLLRKEFTELTARILVSKLKAFEEFAAFIPEHIPHQYTKEMSENSHIVRY